MSKRCRVCLENVFKLYPIKGQIINCDTEIITMVKYCTSIQLEINVGLPDGVCVPCFKTLRIAYNFIVQFKENNEKLLQEKLKVKEDIDKGAEKSEELENYVVIDKEEADESAEYEQNEESEVVDQEVDEEEYEYQEVEVQNLGEFLNHLDKNNASTSLESYQQNVTVKIIQQQEPVNDNSIPKPQTVLRRKIKIRFSCPVCPSAFFASFENGLLPHMSLHDETFQCNVCVDGRFYNSDTFLNHFMKFHRYQCPYCGKSFNRTGTLTAHIKTHSNFRYYCNAEGCTKSFPTSWTLRKHEAVHSSHAAYFCTECDLQFKTYDTYMYHQKKHTGKRFLCMCCGRTFMQSVHLKYHMQQHTGIKQFKCDLCVKSYTSSSQLKKHKKRHHSEPVPELTKIEEMWVEEIEDDFEEPQLEGVI